MNAGRNKNIYYNKNVDQFTYYKKVVSFLHKKSVIFVWVAWLAAIWSTAFSKVLTALNTQPGWMLSISDCSKKRRNPLKKRLLP